MNNSIVEHLGDGQLSMTVDSTERSISSIVRQVLAYASNSSVEVVTPERRLRDLGVDSVGSAGVGVVIQSETGVELDIDELLHLFARGSVDDLIKMVAQLLEMSCLDGDLG